jgi:hypothetical protein
MEDYQMGGYRMKEYLGTDRRCHARWIIMTLVVE